ncbi:MAG: porphobilinogen synthase [Candidatus Azobacteroides pseudotrichonymphae]|jgi:porphobilinogen synthase|nr:MAG: porphobilinogen synthase [Candidatus Azobacteroides pseudotrichonymphae]
MKRFRQYRLNEKVRDFYAEVDIVVSDFIYPYFVVHGEKIKDEIPSMEGVFRFSVDELIKDISKIICLGIDKILLFGIISNEEKDEIGSMGILSDSVICQAVRSIKKQFPQIIIFTDICLCGYTSHGHCGLINNSDIDNDMTLPLLAEMAYQHAIAGADFVAPSAMMDGQVASIRQRLKEEKLSTKILSYSAKYASSFYGPFRDAACSLPSFGSRKTHQMDFRTIGQGLDEVASDIEEGVDWIMVKPAIPYLDMVQRISVHFPNYPLVVYQVSGEYAMLKQGAKVGLFDEKQIFFESLVAIKRAGAKYIISYYAKEFIINEK